MLADAWVMRLRSFSGRALCCRIRTAGRAGAQFGLAEGSYLMVPFPFASPRSSRMRSVFRFLTRRTTRDQRSAVL